jgi:hypothetical protein
VPAGPGCDAHKAIRVSPPRDDFSILDDQCNLLIKNTRENF